MKSHVVPSLSSALFLLLVAGVPRNARGVDVTINWNDVRQEIVGFGASCANENGARMMGVPEPARTQMFDALFDSVKGIGFTIVRCDQPYALLDASGNMVNWDVSYPVAGTFANQAAIMKEAQKRGVAKFWAAPWTPPPMWKQSNQMGGGGSLLRSHYQDYANYQSRFVRECKARYGISLMGISVQNEPQFDPSYGGCPWSGADIRDYIRDYLGPTLKRDSVKISIIAAESNWNEPQYIDPTMDDPNAAKYVDIVGFHQYTGGPRIYSKAFSHGKQVWETEMSNYTSDNSAAYGCDYAIAIWDNFTTGEVNAWHYWWFMMTGGFVQYQNNQLNLGKVIYFFGHYSKFVRPGFRRITCTPAQTTGPGNGKICISAFKNLSSGRFAIVVANRDIVKPQPLITYHFNELSPAVVTPYLTSSEIATQNIEKQPDIPVVNGTFSYMLPNVSIVTFVGQGTPTLVERKPAIQPVSTLPSAAVAAGDIRLHMPNPAVGTATLVDLAGRTVARWTVKALTEQTFAVSSSLPRQVYHFYLTAAGQSLALEVLCR